MASLAYVYVLAAICMASAVQSTQFKKCDNGSPAPLDLRIKGCNTLPCSLVRGSDLEAEWDFETVADSKTLKPRVQVSVLGVTTDYPYPRTNACDDLVNGECPLEKGEEITYSLVMPILKNYPKLPLTIQFALVSENDVSHVCFKVDAKVTD